MTLTAGPHVPAAARPRRHPGRPPHPRAALRPPPAHRPTAFLRTVAESGLTGRGGAAFPVHRKLLSVAEAGRRTGRTPVVVANGAEGEPASRNDRTLLRLTPHLVLDGVQSAAAAAGAGEAHLAVEDGASYLESALAQRQGDPVPVRVVRLPKRSLSGESSALARYVSGAPPSPRTRTHRSANAAPTAPRPWSRTSRPWPTSP
ncbi:hypothetical protein [Streptomyces caeruleatus]|uniref:hypothetical protein n=1 Tax=Streptomyces caeruleatus TaxID=661399 RepID=UPI000ABBE12B|nr:hypothetical protein [Streptomyces caeruleatus]